jgi:hypothetical protein
LFSSSITIPALLSDKSNCLKNSVPCTILLFLYKYRICLK